MADDYRQRPRTTHHTPRTTTVDRPVQSGCEQYDGAALELLPKLLFKFEDVATYAVPEDHAAGGSVNMSGIKYRDLVMTQVPRVG